MFPSENLLPSAPAKLQSVQRLCAMLDRQALVDRAVAIRPVVSLLDLLALARRVKGSKLHNRLHRAQMAVFAGFLMADCQVDDAALAADERLMLALLRHVSIYALGRLVRDGSIGMRLLSDDETVAVRATRKLPVPHRALLRGGMRFTMQDVEAAVIWPERSEALHLCSALLLPDLED